MQPLSSAITGVLSQVRQGESCDGTSPGATASRQLPTVSESSVRDWLLAQPTPAATDKALQTSLQSSHGVALEVRREARFPKEGGYYTVAAGCSIQLKPDATPEQALERMRHAMTPPTSVQAENWLAALQVATAGGRKSESGQELALSLYAGALTRYPADVARAACLDLAMIERPGGNWFPTLAEIISRCERAVGPRRVMVENLRKVVDARRREVAA